MMMRKNKNIDVVIDYLYTIAEKRYQSFEEHGLDRFVEEHLMKIAKQIGYLEQVRNSSKKVSKTKKGKENPENVKEEKA